MSDKTNLLSPSWSGILTDLRGLRLESDLNWCLMFIMVSSIYWCIISHFGCRSRQSSLPLLTSNHPPWWMSSAAHQTISFRISSSRQNKNNEAVSISVLPLLVTIDSPGPQVCFALIGPNSFRWLLIGQWLMSLTDHFVCPQEPLTANQTNTVTCTSYGSNPPAVISWWLDGVKISNMDSQVLFHWNFAALLCCFARMFPSNVLKAHVSKNYTILKRFFSPNPDTAWQLTFPVFSKMMKKHQKWN